MSDLMPNNPERVDHHRCLPLYRASDGKQTMCWCGRNCADDLLLRESNVVNIAWARSVRDFKR